MILLFGFGCSPAPWWRAEASRSAGTGEARCVGVRDCCISAGGVRGRKLDREKESQYKSIIFKDPGCF